MHVKIKKHFLKIFISVFAVMSTFILKGFWDESLNLKNIEDGSRSLFKDSNGHLIGVNMARADVVIIGSSGGGGFSSGGSGDSCGCSSGCGSSDADGCGCSSGQGGNADGGDGGDGGDGCSDGGDSGGSGGSGDAGCFTYQQKVLTPDGSIEIGKLRIGDTVVSYDEKMGAFTNSTIEKVIIHDGNDSLWHDFEKNPLLKLTVEIEEEIISTEVTQNHRYYDPENNLYKTIAEFNVGDKVRAHTGLGVIRDKQRVVSENKPQENKNTIVYNLHMENTPHNYLVNGIVVHNSK